MSRRVGARARRSPAATHAHLEALLARALTGQSGDPVRALARAARDPSLPKAVRAALARADPDGVALSALFVARLRFERLVQGSSEAAAWFERDPAGFTAAFRRYHARVPPRAFFPQDEAALFRAYVARATRRAPRARRKAGR